MLRSLSRSLLFKMRSSMLVRSAEAVKYFLSFSNYIK